MAFFVPVACSYKEAENKKVLFSGTPCQTAALRSFGNSKEIVTVDVVCHGVPSNLAFRKYLSFLERKFGKRVVSVSFRDKKEGENFHVVLGLGDGSENKKASQARPFL
jgi:coenzyme F420-reducing hydrogenase beta subunit